MSSGIPKSAVLALALLAAAPEAAAQERSLSIGASFRHGSLHVGYRSPAPRIAPVRAPSRSYRGSARILSSRCDLARGRSVRATPSRVWIEGEWAYETRRVWIAARDERVWVEPVWATRHDECGEPYTVLVAAGHWKIVRHPGHWETRRVRAWKPGHWQAVAR